MVYLNLFDRHLCLSFHILALLHVVGLGGIKCSTLQRASLDLLSHLRTPISLVIGLAHSMCAACTCEKGILMDRHFHTS